MTRIKINLIKILLLILIVFLFINIISNCIILYQSTGDTENTILILLIFIFGTILGLAIRCGLTLLFWHSYNIKYPDEKYNEKIVKKVFASLLFLLIISLVSVEKGMSLVFIICTLAMIIREQKKTESA